VTPGARFGPDAADDAGLGRRVARWRLAAVALWTLAAVAAVAAAASPVAGDVWRLLGTPTAWTALPLAALAAAPFAAPRRAPLVRARAMLAMSLAISAWMAGGFAQSLHAWQQERRLDRAWAEISARHAAAGRALDEQLRAVDLDRHLAPSELTSAAGIAAARAELARYRRLVAQRTALLRAGVEENARFVATIPPGAARDRAAARAGPSFAAMQAYTDIERAQAGNADAVQALLDWAQANLGHVESDDGRFGLETPAQAEALAALQRRLVATAQAVDAAGAQARARLTRAGVAPPGVPPAAPASGG
jgi:hypothetical protein